MAGILSRIGYVVKERRSTFGRGLGLGLSAFCFTQLLGSRGDKLEDARRWINDVFLAAACRPFLNIVFTRFKRCRHPSLIGLSVILKLNERRLRRHLTGHLIHRNRILRHWRSELFEGRITQRPSCSALRLLRLGKKTLRHCLLNLRSLHLIYLELL